ncbi:MAG: ABC transporter permease [Sphingomonadales bacterium]
MFRRIVTSLIRQAVQRPVMTLLNLVGLTGGIITCVLILFYVQTELNYDSWVPDQDGLYRVEGRFLQSTSGGFTTYTMAPLKAEIDANLTEVESSARMRPQRWPVKRGKFIDYQQIAAVDPGFLDMFPLDYVSGSRAAALPTPNSLLISEAMAEKYFGATPPVGETITLNGDLELTVTGVFHDLPAQSDFKFEFVLPYRDAFATAPEAWGWIGLETYVRLADGASLADIHEKLAVLVDEHRPFVGSSAGDMREIFRFSLQPFADIHLGSAGRSPNNLIGNYAMIYAFAAIAVLILAISAFNYVSLSTARALEREKEICLRKVVGAGRGQIASQILGESIVQTMIAAALGLVFAIDILPYFGSLTGSEYAAGDLLQPANIAIFVSGAILLGTLAGIYPAFFIAGFKPARYLSGGRSKRRGLTRLRSALVFVQFTVAIGLLIGAAAISRQITHLTTLDLGYEADNLIVVRGIDREETISRAEVLKASALALPGVEAVTRSRVVPLDGGSHYEGFYSEFVPRDEGPGLRLIPIDYEFFETLGATLLAGRPLDEKFADDSVRLGAYPEYAETARGGNIILNGTAVQELGFKTPQAALGQPVQLELENGGSQPLTIVGVVSDIRFRTTRFGAGAKIFFHDPAKLRVMTVRAAPGAEQAVHAALGRIWAEMYPDTPFRSDVMVERIDSQYQRVRQQLTLFMIFAGLTMVISLVGLVGLVINSVSHRTKEISLRRVLGASVRDIISMFTWQYLKPVLIANIPAWAIAWYLLSDWLEKYSQRIELGPGLYLMGGGVIATITLLMVITLVTRSALTPPAHALRYE